MQRACVAIALLVCTIIFQVGGRSIHHDGALNKGLRYRGLSHLQLHAAAQNSTKWFNQRIDHFDPTNRDTFLQRYYVNDTFWTGAAKGGPVFIMLGGEGPISPSYVSDHFVMGEYAAKFGALMVAVEHRFYGESTPTDDLSTKNLRLLSTVQALADYAEFHHFISMQYNLTSSNKWISFGGSYSGSLSAWFRLKYPHLIYGSIATSAPVLAQLNFPEYFEVVQQSLGPDCAQKVKRVNDLATKMIQTSDGRSSLQNIFKTCHPIVSDDDVATFFSSLTEGVCEIVQYSNDNVPYFPFNVQKMCSMIVGDTDEELLNSYANLTLLLSPNCTEASYSSMISQMQNVQPGSSVAAARSWTWQTCTEYGYFQTGDSDAQPFSKTISLQWFLKQCNDIFGYPFTPNIVAINDIFGAKNLAETRVILPNGSVDPWHILGITKATPCQQHQGDLVQFMTGTAHCADLYPPSPNDVPDLIATRKVELSALAQWLTSKC